MLLCMQNVGRMFHLLMEENNNWKETQLKDNKGHKQKSPSG
jgi:hypothetical protein